MRIPPGLVIGCCKELAARDNNAGCWAGGEIPACFLEVATRVYQLEPDGIDEGTWLLTVEAAVRSAATHMVADDLSRLREALEETKGHLRYYNDPFYTAALGYVDDGVIDF